MITSRSFRARALAFALVLLGAGAVRASAASPVSVSDAWSRAGGTGAIYATIVNDGDEPDRLIGATTPEAAAVELRATQSAGASPLPALVIPAHGRVTLGPSGPFLALIGQKADLTLDDLFLARIHFERAGWIVATVRVRP